MATNRVYITTPNDMLDLHSIGVSVHYDNKNGSVLRDVLRDSRTAQAMKWYSETSGNRPFAGEYWFIEVEE